MKRESFVFYKSWSDAMGELPNAVRLEVYDAVIRYALGGSVQGLAPLAQVAFAFIKHDIDRMNEKYDDVVAKNRENGKKGGRPKKELKINELQKPNKTQKTQVVFSETQKTLNDNDKDIILSTPNVVDSVVGEILEEQDLVAKKPKTRAREVSAVDPLVVDVSTCRVTGEQWRQDFDAYKSGLRQCYLALLGNAEWLAERKRLNPGVNVKLTLEKACVEFWATEAGWQNKRGKRTKTIDWKATLTKAISQTQNKVYNNGKRTDSNDRGGISDEFRESILRDIGAI